MLRRVFGILLLVLLAIAGWQWITFPDVTSLRNQWPKTTAFMELRKRELRAAGKDDTLQYHPVPYARISPYLRRRVHTATPEPAATATTTTEGTETTETSQTDTNHT